LRRDGDENRTVIRERSASATSLPYRPLGREKRREKEEGLPPHCSGILWRHAKGRKRGGQVRREGKGHKGASFII